MCIISYEILHRIIFLIVITLKIKFSVMSFALIILVASISVGINHIKVLSFYHPHLSSFKDVINLINQIINNVMESHYLYFSIYQNLFALPMLWISPFPVDIIYILSILVILIVFDNILFLIVFVPLLVLLWIVLHVLLLAFMFTILVE